MAARLWRWVLAGELALAVAGAWVFARALSMPLAYIILLALLAFIALQVLLVAASLVLGWILTPRSHRRLNARQALRVCFTEAPAFARTKFAMSVESWRSLSDDPTPEIAGQAARPVLLVHGVLCNRAVWGALRCRLRAAGFGPIRAINLEPPAADIETCADQMVREASALRGQAGGRRVEVVAHSMGGLVARAALRRGASDSIGQLITVATPHHGSVLVRFVPGPAREQFQPQSPWLQALNSPENALPAGITSIYSEDDNLVAPARSAVLIGAQCLALRGIGHFGMLRSPQALDAVIATLQSAPARGNRES